jgi:hypothetical protein
MRNPTLLLFGEQIESVKAEIEGIELHILSIKEEGAGEQLSREIGLLRCIEGRYRDLLAALEAAANSLKPVN